VSINTSAPATSEAPAEQPQAHVSVAPPAGGAISSQAPLAALCAIARLHQVAADPATLAHQLGLSGNEPFQLDDLLQAAQHLGLKAKRSKTGVERLALTPLPALALMRTDDGSLRVVILAQCDGQRVLLQDPAAGAGSNRPTIEPLDVFASQWTGELILITSRASMAGELAKFDFSWFIPSLVKHRKLLGEVLLISFMLQLFALVSPLFFQVVMDKVLVHRGLTTLDVLVIGLVGVVSSLEISVIGTADKITLSGWYSAYRIEEFKTADGKTLLDNDVHNLVQAMAAFAPPAAGQTTLLESYAAALNPVIAANWQ
jgi:subfamily B ATP-binding cassette protein HlyB/CyaB